MLDNEKMIALNKLVNLYMSKMGLYSLNDWENIFRKIGVFGIFNDNRASTKLNTIRNVFTILERDYPQKFHELLRYLNNLTEIKRIENIEKVELNELLNVFESNKENNKRNEYQTDLYKLKLLYEKLLAILDYYFSGDIIVDDSKLNEYYIKTCVKIENIIESYDKDFLKNYERPMAVLQVTDPDYPEGDWELGLRKHVQIFQGMIMEEFIKNGEVFSPLDENFKKFIEDIEKYLINKYNITRKNIYPKNFEEKVSKMEPLNVEQKKKIHKNFKMLLEYENTHQRFLNRIDMIRELKFSIDEAKQVITLFENPIQYKAQEIDLLNKLGTEVLKEFENPTLYDLICKKGLFYERAFKISKYLIDSNFFSSFPRVYIKKETLIAKKNHSEVNEIILSKKIFIVHGHDGEMKEATARMLGNLGLEPIILHEQPSKNKTIIEKIESYSNVSFAIALLSPDDEAHPRDKPIEKKPRARQNVILELGYFLGKLGRDKVLALFKGGSEFELPSDIHGVIYVPYDAAGKWKFEIVKELNAIGYKLDANKVNY